MLPRVHGLQPNDCNFQMEFIIATASERASEKKMRNGKKEWEEREKKESKIKETLVYRSSLFELGELNIISNAFKKKLNEYMDICKKNKTKIHNDSIKF